MLQNSDTLPEVVIVDEGDSATAAIKDAFASQCGRACAADRRALVPDEQDVQILLLDTQSA